MGGLVAKLVFKNGKEGVATGYTSFNDIPSVDIDGNAINRLGDILTNKKAILVVNVAEN